METNLLDIYKKFGRKNIEESFTKRISKTSSKDLSVTANERAFSFIPKESSLRQFVLDKGFDNGHFDFKFDFDVPYEGGMIDKNDKNVQIYGSGIQCWGDDFDDESVYAVWDVYNDPNGIGEVYMDFYKDLSQEQQLSIMSSLNHNLELRGFRSLRSCIKESFTRKIGKTSNNDIIRKSELTIDSYETFKKMIFQLHNSKLSGFHFSTNPNYNTRKGWGLNMMLYTRDEQIIFEYTDKWENSINICFQDKRVFENDNGFEDTDGNDGLVIEHTLIIPGSSSNCWKMLNTDFEIEDRECSICYIPYTELTISFFGKIVNYIKSLEIYCKKNCWETPILGEIDSDGECNLDEFETDEDLDTELIDIFREIKNYSIGINESFTKKTSNISDKNIIRKSNFNFIASDIDSLMGILIPRLRKYNIEIEKTDGEGFIMYNKNNPEWVLEISDDCDYDLSDYEYGLNSKDVFSICISNDYDSYTMYPSWLFGNKRYRQESYFKFNEINKSNLKKIELFCLTFCEMIGYDNLEYNSVGEFIEDMMPIYEQSVKEFNMNESFTKKTGSKKTSEIIKNSGPCIIDFNMFVEMMKNAVEKGIIKDCVYVSNNKNRFNYNLSHWQLIHNIYDDKTDNIGFEFTTRNNNFCNIWFSTCGYFEEMNFGYMSAGNHDIRRKEDGIIISFTCREKSYSTSNYEILIDENLQIHKYNSIEEIPEFDYPYIPYSKFTLDLFHKIVKTLDNLGQYLLKERPEEDRLTSVEYNEIRNNENYSAIAVKELIEPFLKKIR